MRWVEYASCVMLPIAMLISGCQPTSLSTALSPEATLSQVAEENAPNLFVYVAEEGLDLTNEQKTQLDIYDADVTNEDSTTIAVDDTMLTITQAVGLNLPSVPKIVLSHVQRIETQSAQNFIWYGMDESEQTLATIAVLGEDIVGSIQTAENIYRIRPLGNGLQALSMIERARLPDEHLPESVELEATSAQDAAQDAEAAPSDAPIISILVAYTPAAKRQAGNIEGLIQLAVNLANMSYMVSGVHQRLELVHSFELDTRKNSMLLDQEFIRSNADVRSLAEVYAADVTVLITANHEACGTSGESLRYAPVQTPEYAFVTVSYSCIDVHTLAHEIGHLQGLRHNPEVDPTNTPFAYGHGYAQGEWRTIMAYACPHDCMRLPMWSNPNMTFNGEAMGTEEQHNEARALNETGHLLAAIRAAPTITEPSDPTIVTTDPTSPTIGTTDPMSSTIISIMIAYTPGARDAVPNIDATISQAISETNQTYVNSGVHQRLELVHSYEIDTGRTDIIADLDFISTDPTTRILGEKYKADVTILVPSLLQACAISQSIGPVRRPEDAFGVVTIQCLTWEYSLAHTLGHLQGLRHNPEVDPTDTPFPYGHGYAQGKWRTIMAYDCPKGCPLVPYWSNPHIFYDGEPLGTEAQHNEAQVLNKTAQIIANLR